MTTALKAINGGSKQRSDRKLADADKSIRPHCKVSIEDINWVRQQPPSVQQLWLDSVAAEQFGGSAHKLDTNLTYKSLQKAGAALTAQGLFQFEEVFGRLPSGRPGLIGYRVRNLHGYYNRFYWESYTSAETNSCDEEAVHAGEKINQPGRNQNHPEVERIQPDLESFQKNGQKSEVCCGFQNPNNVSNYPLTTYQQPTKVVGMVVGSDTPSKNLREEEAAIAPFGGASPSTVGSVSEKREELPAVTDCTTLTLVNAVQSQPTSLITENQASGDEIKGPHEDTHSAPPVDQNEECLQQAIATQEQVEQSQPTSLIIENQASGDEVKGPDEYTYSEPPVAPNEKRSQQAIAPQTHKQVESSQPTSLSTENQVSGDEVKAHHEDKISAVSVPGAEKWSSEAIAARSKARSGRIERLKMAEILGNNPGFEFLQECWDDDPALRIVIKKLLAKFGQWGFVVADGVLVKCKS